MLRYQFRISTPENIARIRDMAEKGRSAFEIAQAIGSTAASVRVLCSRLKIRIKRGRRAPHDTYDIVAHMPAPLYAEFHRKADRLRMSPSALASNLLVAITTGNIFEAVLDDHD